MERARDGDPAAFRQLYDAQHRRVYALALRLTARREEAEELTQECFLAAWRQLPGYRGEAALSTWLHGIVTHLCLRRRRGAARRRRREERYGREAYPQAVRASMPDADLALETALAALPRRQRTALVLHAVEGYTQAETAELMGVAEGTVKAHVHRARRALRRQLTTPEPIPRTATGEPE